MCQALQAPVDPFLFSSPRIYLPVWTAPCPQPGSLFNSHSPLLLLIDEYCQATELLRMCVFKREHREAKPRFPTSLNPAWNAEGLMDSCPHVVKSYHQVGGGGEGRWGSCTCGTSLPEEYSLISRCTEAAASNSFIPIYLYFPRSKVFKNRMI